MGDTGGEARDRVIVVIAAYNEAERIAATVRAAAGIGGVAAVIVADDASADDTAPLAEAAGARVLRLAENRGKGRALAAGLAAARDEDPSATVLLLDGDLGETATEGARLLPPILDGSADMTVAVLPKPPGSGGFGLVLRLARFGIRRLGGWEARAPLSGQRALTAAAVRAAGTPAPGFGVEVAMTVRVLRAGLRVAEVEAEIGHAATGRDLAGFVHRGKQFADVAKALVMLALEPRPRAKL